MKKFKIKQYRIYLCTKEIEAESRVDAIAKFEESEEETKALKALGMEFYGYPRQGMTLSGFYEDEVEHLRERSCLDWYDGDNIVLAIKSVKEMK